MSAMISSSNSVRVVLGPDDERLVPVVGGAISAAQVYSELELGPMAGRKFTLNLGGQILDRGYMLEAGDVLTVNLKALDKGAAMLGSANAVKVQLGPDDYVYIPADPSNGVTAAQIKAELERGSMAGRQFVLNTAGGRTIDQNFVAYPGDTFVATTKALDKGI